MLAVARRGAYGGLGDGVVGSEDFEGFGVAGGAVVLVLEVVELGVGHWFALRLDLPGMCEDDVVARSVSAASTGCGRAGEAEFEDHDCGVCGVLGIVYAGLIQCRGLDVRRSPTICGRRSLLT